MQKFIVKIPKRNEEIALMAILFRILFTLGLLILHVSVLSGEQTTSNLFSASELNFSFLFVFG